MPGMSLFPQPAFLFHSITLCKYVCYQYAYLLSSQGLTDSLDYYVTVPHKET